MKAGGLHPPVGQSIGLDFVNASSAPSHRGSEAISDRDSLLRWLEERKLVASDAIASIRANTSSDELNAVWAEAKALGAWFRDFVDDFKGKPLPASAADRLQLLNGILARDAQIEQIDIRDNLNDRIAGSGLRRSTRRIWRSADMLLLPIARAMAELICTADFSSIRVCDGPGCGTFFLDRTRERTRRRCRAGICGRLKFSSPV
jgi:Putative stress-induced transcription regulator/CGNR zinc finger